MSSQLGSLRCVSPPLQKQFSSLTLTEAEIVALMEKYLRYAYACHNQLLFTFIDLLRDGKDLA